MVYRGYWAEKGQVVPESEAYGYALDRCLNGTEAEQQEFKDMLVEWYFSSGDWLLEEEKIEEKEADEEEMMRLYGKTGISEIA